MANKFLVVVLSLLAVGALIGLAIGLPSMPFRERQVFGQKEAGVAGNATLDLVDAVLSIPIRTQLTIWFLLALLAFLIGLVMSPEMRKWLLRLVLRAAAMYWLLYIFATRYREQLAQMVLNVAPLNATPASASNAEPIPAFTPPQGSTWLSYTLALGLAALLAFGSWRAYSIWRSLNTPSPLDELGKIARSSLNDLSTGHASGDVIMNCYYRMSAVVAEKKQLDRAESMTPAEFAMRLEQAGLPGEAVKRLTRLFESVRYGGHKTNSAMINEAVTCLTTIAQYCGATA